MPTNRRRTDRKRRETDRQAGRQASDNNTGLAGVYTIDDFLSAAEVTRMKEFIRRLGKHEGLTWSDVRTPHRQTGSRQTGPGRQVRVQTDRIQIDIVQTGCKQTGPARQGPDRQGPDTILAQDFLAGVVLAIAQFWMKSLAVLD